MLYKLINEKRIESVAKNDFIIIDDKRVGISNLPKYLEKHPDIALANGYYELIETEQPAYDAETQYPEYKYVVEDNKIHKTWIVNDIVIPD